MDNEKDYDYEIRLKIEDIRLLHYCVMETIRTWLVLLEDLPKNKNILDI